MLLPLPMDPLDIFKGEGDSNMHPKEEGWMLIWVFDQSRSQGNGARCPQISLS